MPVFRDPAKGIPVRSAEEFDRKKRHLVQPKFPGVSKMTEHIHEGPLREDGTFHGKESDDAQRESLERTP